MIFEHEKNFNVDADVGLLQESIDTKDVSEHMNKDKDERDIQLLRQAVEHVNLFASSRRSLQQCDEEQQQVQTIHETADKLADDDVQIISKDRLRDGNERNSLLKVKTIQSLPSSERILKKISAEGQEVSVLASQKKVEGLVNEGKEEAGQKSLVIADGEQDLGEQQGKSIVSVKSSNSQPKANQVNHRAGQKSGKPVVGQDKDGVRYAVQGMVKDKYSDSGSESDDNSEEFHSFTIERDVNANEIEDPNNYYEQLSMSFYNSHRKGDYQTRKLIEQSLKAFLTNQKQNPVNDKKIQPLNNKSGWFNSDLPNNEKKIQLFGSIQGDAQHRLKEKESPSSISGGGFRILKVSRGFGENAGRKQEAETSPVEIRRVLTKVPVGVVVNAVHQQYAGRAMMAKTKQIQNIDLDAGFRGGGVKVRSPKCSFNRLIENDHQIRSILTKNGLYGGGEVTAGGGGRGGSFVRRQQDEERKKEKERVILPSMKLEEQHVRYVDIAHNRGSPTNVLFVEGKKNAFKKKFGDYFDFSVKEKFNGDEQNCGNGSDRSYGNMQKNSPFLHDVITRHNKRSNS